MRWHPLAKKLQQRKPMSESPESFDEAADSRLLQPRPVLPLLVACHTDVQLDIFCRNHQVRRRDVVRIRREEDIRGRRKDRPIHLLPDWWQGTDQGTIPMLENYGWKMASVTEEEVLNGTFSWQSS